MTPRGRWPTPDGDNTPQGKLANGCMWLIAWVGFTLLTVGATDLLRYWWGL